MQTISGALSAFMLLAVVGCAPAGPAASRPASSPQDGATAGLKKTLGIGQINTVRMYGPWDFGNTAGGGSALLELHTVSLKTSGRNGGVEPRIAERLPSFDDGSIVVLPDGRMRVTWTLRRDVKWHDGARLTADDLAFSWQLAVRPDLPASSRMEAGTGRAMVGC